MVWALPDGLSGHAQAGFETSTLHIQAHLYLVDDLRALGQDAHMSRRGSIPFSAPLRTRIECAQTTCNNGRARSQSKYGHQAAAASNRHLCRPGATWPIVEHRQSQYCWTRHIDADEHTGEWRVNESLNRCRWRTLHSVTLIFVPTKISTISPSNSS